MAEHLIQMDQDDNSEYKKLVDEHNKLIMKYDSFMTELSEIDRIPLFFLFGLKSRLKKFLGYEKELKEEFMKWYQRASKFVNEPTYNIPQSAHGGLTFVHFTTLMAYRISDVNTFVTLFSESLVQTKNAYENRKSMLIAVAGIIISIIPAIYSFFFDKSFDEIFRSSDLNCQVQEIATQLDSIYENFPEFEKFGVQNQTIILQFEERLRKLEQVDSLLSLTGKKP